MPKNIVRAEVLKHIKVLWEANLIEKFKTKELEDADLLEKFMLCVEDIPEDSPEERAIPVPTARFYNRMAREYEREAEVAVQSFVESDGDSGEPNEQVQEVIDHIDQKKPTKTKSALTQITDIMTGLPEDSKKDIFGYKVTSKEHAFLKRLVAGKSEGFIVKKDYADKSEIKAAVKHIQAKFPDVNITKESDGDKFFYRFYARKSFFKK